MGVEFCEQMDCTLNFKVERTRVERPLVSLCVSGRAEPALHQLLNPSLERFDSNDRMVEPPVTRLQPTAERHGADLPPSPDIAPELGETGERKFVGRQRPGRYLVKRFEAERYIARHSASFARAWNSLANSRAMSIGI